MKPTFRPLAAAAALALAASVACAPGAPEPFRTVPVQSGAASEARVVRPGAPGQATRIASTVDLDAAATRLPHGDADVRFMQGMIPHHAQALEMTALVEARTRSEDIRLLARRIEISQHDEIAQMSRWLEERGEAVPGEHAHHMMGDHALMPGMLSAADMASLRGARGAGFDRLFLEHMIRHHEGALVMVRELFATPGAGQESMISVFAAHVEADQQIEIERMRRMLLARP